MRRTYREYELYVGFKSKEDLEELFKKDEWAKRFLDVYDSDEPRDENAAIITSLTDESLEDFEFNMIEKIETEFGLEVVDHTCDATGYYETYEE